MRIGGQPGLYDPEDPRPVLFGSRCDACGSTRFPAMTIGCDACGAPEVSLVRTRLRAAGTIRSVATVHLHSGKDIAAPFTIAEIALDEGPLIRATLAHVADVDAIGRRVEADWEVVRVDDNGVEVVEPRFAEIRS
jgi:hypothetical protein